MYWIKLIFVLLPFVNVKTADDNIGSNRKWDNYQAETTAHRVPRPVPKPIEINPVKIAANTESPTTESAYESYTTAPRARLAQLSRPETTSNQTSRTDESTSPTVTSQSTSEPPIIILIKKSEPENIPTISEPAANSSSPVSSNSSVVEPKSEEIKVVNISKDPSSSVDLNSLAATASPATKVIVVLLNDDSEKPDLKTDKDSNTNLKVVKTPQPSTDPIEISPSYIELPSNLEPAPVQKNEGPAPNELVILITPRPLPSKESTKKPQPVQTPPPPPAPTMEPARITEIKPEEKSRPPPAPVEIFSPRIIQIILPREEAMKSKSSVNEPVIAPTNERPVSLTNSRPKLEEPKTKTKVTVEPKPAPAPVEPIVVYRPTPAPAPAPPASNVIVYRPSQSWESTKKPTPVQTAPSPPAPIMEPAIVWEIESEEESRPLPAPVETSSSTVIKMVLPREEAAKSNPLVNELVIAPTNRRPISLFNSRNDPEEPIIIVSPTPETIEPKPAPAPAHLAVVEYRPQLTAAPANPELIYIEQRPKPTFVPVTPTTFAPSQLFDYNCRDTNGFYGVANDCDSYVECKKHVAKMFTCPQGLHFNPKAIWPDYPCGYPWEVECESNALELFDGFTCPEPPMDALGAPLDFISKYRYGQSCRQYVTCQHGRPRLLSCNPGFSFDEDSQVCIDSDYVLNCLS